MGLDPPRGDACHGDRSPHTVRVQLHCGEELSPIDGNLPASRTRPASSRAGRTSTTLNMIFQTIRPKLLWISGILLICLVAAGAFSLRLLGESPGNFILNSPTNPVPAEFFGLHIHRAFTTTPWPSVPFGSWRLWDARVHWPQVEIRKNEWQWDILDREVELAEKHRVDLLLPFGETPDWAAGSRGETSSRFRNARPFGGVLVGDVADLEDWRNFVRTQALRYKGRIQYYEIWNEPNLPRNRDIGTPERMLTLAREAYVIVKQVDPNIKVVS